MCELYSQETILKAAELAGICSIDAKYLCSLLDGANTIVNKDPPKYELLTPKKLIEDVCHCMNISYRDIVIADRTRKLADTRASCAVLLSTSFSKITIREIADLLFRDCSTISYYLIEAKRCGAKQKIYMEIKNKLNL